MRSLRKRLKQELTLIRGSVKYLILIALLGFAVSCKTSKDFYNSKGELRNIPDAKLISGVSKNYLEYNAVFYKKFKAKVSFNGKTDSFKGNLYIQKDNSIVVSIIPLMGVELFRVKLSKDVVEIIDRPKKRYSYGDYKLLWDKFLIELNYNSLQSILTNKLFVYPLADNDYLKRYKHYCSDGKYQLQSLKEGKFSRKYKKEKTENIIFHQFSILPEIFKISDVYIKDFSANSEITIKYSNFIEKDNTLVPTSLKIDGKRGLDNFSLSIIFENIDVNSQNSIGFKVSDKYKTLNLNNAK